MNRQNVSYLIQLILAFFVFCILGVFPWIYGVVRLAERIWG